jgi:hypothetical protein
VALFWKEVIEAFCVKTGQWPNVPSWCESKYGCIVLSTTKLLSPPPPAGAINLISDHLFQWLIDVFLLPVIISLSIILVNIGIMDMHRKNRIAPNSASYLGKSDATRSDTLIKLKAMHLVYSQSVEASTTLEQSYLEYSIWERCASEKKWQKTGWNSPTSPKQYSQE